MFRSRPGRARCIFCSMRIVSFFERVRPLQACCRMRKRVKNSLITLPFRLQAYKRNYCSRVDAIARRPWIDDATRSFVRERTSAKMASIPTLPISLPTQILSFLIPSPSAPLPPDVLSTALHQHHQFITRSLDEPISHFTLAVDSRKSELLEEGLAEVARSLGAGDVRRLSGPPPSTARSDSTLNLNSS